MKQSFQDVVADYAFTRGRLANLEGQRPWLELAVRALFKDLLGRRGRRRRRRTLLPTVLARSESDNVKLPPVLHVGPPRQPFDPGQLGAAGPGDAETC